MHLHVMASSQVFLRSRKYHQHQHRMGPLGRQYRRQTCLRQLYLPAPGMKECFQLHQRPRPGLLQHLVLTQMARNTFLRLAKCTRSFAPWTSRLMHPPARMLLVTTRSAWNSVKLPLAASPSHTARLVETKASATSENPRVRCRPVIRTMCISTSFLASRASLLRPSLRP